MDKKTIQLLEKIPGWLSIHEGQFLLKAVRLTSKLRGEIVEIGSFKGKSTIWLGKTGQKVYAIDPHQGDLGSRKISPTLQSFENNIKKAGVDRNVTPIVKTSSQAIKNWNKKIRLLFIDGLHDEKNAQQDFKLWNPYLVDNGIVAMHDSFCGFKGAEKAALKNIVFSSDFFEIGVVGSIIYGIKGSKNGLMKLNKIRCQLLIRRALQLNQLNCFPKAISFLIIHRLIKLFLLNRFTIKRN